MLIISIEGYEFENTSLKSIIKTISVLTKRNLDGPLQPDAIDTDSFVSTVNCHLETFLSHTHFIKSQRNITSSQGRVIKELQSIRDIVIKPADKGGTIVIQNRSGYIKELQSNWDIVIKPADKGGAIVIQNRSGYIKELQ